MPRTGHGGRRQGEQGASYSNRTDLNAHVPIATVPDQPYGERAQQQQAQQVVPMAPTQVAPQAAAPARPLMPLNNSPKPQGAAPGSLPFLDPTQRPNEPVTAGVDFGPGPGSEVMNQNTAPVRPISAAINEIAQSPNASPAVSTLAEAAKLLGL